MAQVDRTEKIAKLWSDNLYEWSENILKISSKRWNINKNEIHTHPLDWYKF